MRAGGALGDLSAHKALLHRTDRCRSLVAVSALTLAYVSRCVSTMRTNVDRFLAARNGLPPPHYLSLTHASPVITPPSPNS